MTTNDKALPAAERYTISKHTGTNTSEAPPSHADTPHQLDAPDDVAGKEVESIDDLDGAEDIDGYGHGV